MIRLRSVTTSAQVAAKKSVAAANPAVMSAAVGASSYRLWKRAIRYTPAVTIVAAWISALTGVGPSIASGSQVWSGNCADFASAPPSRPSATSAATVAVSVARGIKDDQRVGAGDDQHHEITQRVGEDREAYVELPGRQPRPRRR